MIKKKVTSPSFVKKMVVKGQFIEEETDFVTYI